MAGSVDQHVYPGEFLIALIFASNGVVLLLMAVLSPTVVGTLISLVVAVSLYLLANCILLHRYNSHYISVVVAVLLCLFSAWTLLSGELSFQAIIAIPSMGWAVYYLLRHRDRWAITPESES